MANLQSLPRQKQTINKPLLGLGKSRCTTTFEALHLWRLGRFEPCGGLRLGDTERKRRNEHMTTKAQEREALKKIEKIIADLGEGSYVATAFEGCVEIAAQNIEFDAAFSMQGRAESAEVRAETAKEKAEDLRRERDEARGAVETYRQAAYQYRSLASEYEQKAADLRQEVEKRPLERDATTDCLDNLSEALAEAEKKAEALEAENIRLKARLFDLLNP